MSLCYDFQKWSIISMLTILTVCLVGMVNLAFGQTPSSNATGDAMSEANEIISTASNISSNATERIESNSTTTTNSKSLPIQYTNYTSDKYRIQFQYPSDWLIEEKTNRFEEADITISNPNSLSDSMAIIFRNDFLKDFGLTDVQSGVISLHEDILNSFKYDYRSIEPPSFLDIDGQRTGTFVVTGKQKYETNPITLAGQTWLTKVGNSGYMMEFFSSPQTFDSPENTEIHDHFIKSIKFLGINNASSTNTTSR
jgi:PsbP-like protein